MRQGRICARLESRGFIDVTRVRRGHVHHGDRRGCGAALQRAHDVVGAHVRQIHGEHNQVRFLRRQAAVRRGRSPLPRRAIPAKRRVWATALQRLPGESSTTSATVDPRVCLGATHRSSICGSAIAAIVSRTALIAAPRLRLRDRPTRVRCSLSSNRNVIGCASKRSAKHVVQHHWSRNASHRLLGNFSAGRTRDLVAARAQGLSWSRCRCYVRRRSENSARLGRQAGAELSYSVADARSIR